MKHADKTIEDILQSYKPVTGKDHDKYRNHVYRVFLNCLLLDKDQSNREKYAVAAAFHDIGIWTNHTFDYLAPSIEQAKIYLSEMNKAEWLEEITQMIYWHHKISKYEGAFRETVETFRKADWTDVSLGLMTFGADRKELRENRKQLPNLGFHWFLIKQTVKNLLRHPLNPLPVFKK